MSAMNHESLSGCNFQLRVWTRTFLVKPLRKTEVWCNSYFNEIYLTFLLGTFNSCYYSWACKQNVFCWRLNTAEAYGSIQWEMTSDLKKEKKKKVWLGRAPIVSFLKPRNLRRTSWWDPHSAVTPQFVKVSTKHRWVEWQQGFCTGNLYVLDS